MSALRPSTSPDISGQLRCVRETYRKWFGTSYDLGALDCVLSAAATEKLWGDPPWMLMIGGSGAAKTETLMPLAGARAQVVSTITGEAALMSGTSKRERSADATGGLLRLMEAQDRGLLVIKDVTSILSMNRDTRALVLAALREIYDGRWSRTVGTDGGQELLWKGRIVVLGACTTAWDAAHQVIATMGDRFVLVRLTGDAESRRAAGKKAMRNVSHEKEMREELTAAVGSLLQRAAQDSARLDLSETEEETVFGLADLVTRTRTAVEKDARGEPLFAHAAEWPTRLAKQFVQLGRGGLALGMPHESAMLTVMRCAGDTMPPLRLRVLADVAASPFSTTADVVKRLQLPRKTVDRTLQELHLLELLAVTDEKYGDGVRWRYNLAADVDRAALGKLAGNVSGGQEGAA